MIALTACVASPAPAADSNAPTNGEVVLFLNGDVLRGTMAGYDPDKGLLWRRNDTARPLTLNPAQLANVFLERTTPRPEPVKNACRVELANGDELVGVIKSLTDQSLVLSTTYAGELTIPRGHLARIQFSHYPGRLVFEGPHGDDGWTHGEMNAAQGAVRNQWFFHNGAFVSTDASSIARDVKMPFEAIMEFDLNWNGAYMLAVGLYTDSLQPISLNQRDKEPEFKSFYSLQMNTYSAMMMVVPKEGGLRQLGSVAMNIPAGSTNAHVAVLASRTNKMVLLLVNGHPVQNWVDPEGWSGLGTGLRFVHQGAGAVRISNLRIYEWDGKTKPPPPISNHPTMDITRLVDNQVLGGRIMGCDGTNFTLNSGGQNISFQLDRGVEWRFATVAQMKSPVGPRDVRLHFRDRGRLTLQLVEWKEKEVVVLSPPFGRVVMNPAVFGRINFNPR